MKKTKLIKKSKEVTKAEPDDLETPGEFDKNGIYRLGVPMESYDIVKHYQKIAGKLADFIDYVVPMLSGDAYSRKSIVRILDARGPCGSSDWDVDSFVMALRHFQMHLAQGFSKVDWLKEGEKVARAKATERNA